MSTYSKKKAGRIFAKMKMIITALLPSRLVLSSQVKSIFVNAFKTYLHKLMNFVKVKIKKTLPERFSTCFIHGHQHPPTMFLFMLASLPIIVWVKSTACSVLDLIKTKPNLALTNFVNIHFLYFIRLWK